MAPRPGSQGSRAGQQERADAATPRLPGRPCWRGPDAVAAAAAGVVAIDGIWQEIKDQKGLQQDCKLGRELGYAGKSIIHPDQIKITHKIFHPNSSEILWSKLVVKEYEKSTKKGKGAIVVDGKMIDEVHYKQAKALLEII